MTLCHAHCDGGESIDDLNPENGIFEVTLAPAQDTDHHTLVFLSPHQFGHRCSLKLKYEMFRLHLSTSPAPFPDSSARVKAVFAQEAPCQVWRGAELEDRRRGQQPDQPGAVEIVAEPAAAEIEQEQSDNDAEDPEDPLLNIWLEGLADNASSSAHSSCS